MNYKCTAQQIKDRKTVFVDEQEFYRFLASDDTMCQLGDTSIFTFDQNARIPDPMDYIEGIDCTTGEWRLFEKYFIQYKRALQDPRPANSTYLKSNTVTVWTFYPVR